MLVCLASPLNMCHLNTLLLFDRISVFPFFYPLDVWISPLLFWTDPKCGLWAAITWLFSWWVGRIELQGFFFLSCTFCEEGKASFPSPLTFSSFCLCFLWHVPVLLLKNSDFIVISVWASFVLHFKQAQWFSLVKILTACQYFFSRK